MAAASEIAMGLSSDEGFGTFLAIPECWHGATLTGGRPYRSVTA